MSTLPPSSYILTGVFWFCKHSNTAVRKAPVPPPKITRAAISFFSKTREINNPKISRTSDGKFPCKSSVGKSVRSWAEKSFGSIASIKLMPGRPARLSDFSRSGGGLVRSSDRTPHRMTGRTNSFVPRERIELSIPCEKQLLRLSCLPISPPRLNQPYNC